MTVLFANVLMLTCVQQTLIQIFRKELQSLADLLEDSERHYVRCIKPNESKMPLEFDPVKVLQQLKR